MVGRKRQFDIADALLDEFQPNRPNTATGPLTTSNAPEALARLSKLLIPSLALEAPPKAVRIEDGAVAAFAHGLDALAPRRCLENIGGNAEAVFGVARHVTTTVPIGRHRVRFRRRRRSGPRWIGQAR